MDTQFAIKYLKSVANSALVKQIQAHDEHPYSKIITEENLVHLVGSNEVNAWQHAYMAGLLSIKTNNGIISLLLGYGKEILLPLEWSKDTLRDLYNNSRGIETAKGCTNASDLAKALYEKQYDTDPSKVGGSFKEDPPYLIVNPEDDSRVNASVIINDIKGIVKDISLISLGTLPANVSPCFTQAQQTSPTTFIDPIIIDLNNDGKLSTTTIDNGTYFDHGNDGFAETSSWVSPNDGILAIDKNNNGYIDNGNEIFGDNYNIISINFWNMKYKNNLNLNMA